MTNSELLTYKTEISIGFAVEPSKKVIVPTVNESLI